MPEERESMLREAGKKIQSRRESAGYTLEDVHEGTKIRINFLEGIEQGDYSGFPGTVYVRGFIRTYLQFLGAEELWSEFLPMLSEGMEKKRPEEMVVGSCTPPTKGFKPASRFWLFVFLFMIVIGSGWYVWYSWDQSGISFFSLNGEQDQQALVNHGDTPSDGLRPGETPAFEEKTSEGDTTGEISTGEDSAEPAGDTAGAALKPDLPTAAELIGVTESPVATVEKKPEPNTLVITADGDCWVRVRVEGKTVFERTMRSGDTADFKVTKRHSVTYGRGSAARVTWNGKDIGKPGRGVERVFYDPDGTTGKEE